MAELDAILEECTNPNTGSLHGATFVAIDSKGNDIYRKSFGYQKVDTKNSPLLTADTVTWIASQTKLTTSVAMMQLVEKGLVGLDDDARDILPRLKDLKVITGWEGEDGQPVDCNAESHVDLDEVSQRELRGAKGWEEKPEGRPILKDVNGSITLRQLITHTSGFCYDLGHPLLIKYSAWAGRRQENMFSGTIEGQFYPLVFQPGTSWQYGPGLDWAGEVIAKVTGMEYDEYQQKYIWGPLGAKNTTFFPAKRGLTEADIQETAHRTLGPENLKAGPSAWRFDCRDALGGGGLYSTANDYSKLLAALLAGGGPLLSRSSVDELFLPQQLGPGPIAALREFIIGTSPDATKSLTWTQSIEQWRDVMEIRQCLCGVVNSEDVKGRRRRNTVSWDGLPNLIWFIDRESGVTATFITQLMPVGDMLVRQMLVDLEEALYRLVDRQ